MKNLSFYAVLFLSITNGFAASSKVACIAEAKTWFYNNTSDTSASAQEHAISFCSGGGTVECIAEAKNWFYNNTSDTSASAQVHAIQFCSGKL